MGCTPLTDINDMEYHRTGYNLRAAVGGPVENIIASAENWGERKTVS
jgi:hypothetical protein